MMREIKVDLHNHSSYSYDASNRFAHYKKCFDKGLFHILGITDHNNIRARNAFQNDEFRVIFGEEIDTKDGELVGLFLDEHIKPGRSIFDTAKEIRERQGLVYLQHPFYRWLRNRVHSETVHALLHHGLVDVIETANGGPLMTSCNRKAAELARHWDIPQGAGSDAHHPTDIARCTVRVQLAKDPFELTKDDLLTALRHGEIDRKRVRNSAVTLSVRLGYSVKVNFARLGGAERKSRQPE